MKIVGVTSCIAGLAHTPMAAKALEKATQQLGYEIKVEQQGAMGQVNKLTEEDILCGEFCTDCGGSNGEGHGSVWR